MDTAKLQIAPEMETLKTKLKATWISGDLERSPNPLPTVPPNLSSG